MTIGIDARLYGAGHGGLGRYTQKLIEHLEKIDNANQYVVFLAADGFASYQPRNKNWRKVLADFRVYGWREQLIFPWLIKKQRLDLMHFTHFNVPFFYGGRFLATIHDLIISHYPDSRATTLPPIIYKIKLFFYGLIVKAAARQAEKIIAVSKFSKNDIIKFLGVKAEKIAVIYEGFDLPRPSGKAEDVLSRLGLSAQAGLAGDFLLYVGSAYPHKNLENLLLAFKKIAIPDLKLVLVGKSDFFYQRLSEKIKEQGLVSKVVLAGRLADEELAVLYQKARVYVFSSLLEGFGLPALEAQQYGLPVAASTAGSLPEILGDSAIYFNPQDTKDMAQKINIILTDENLRQDLTRRGRENIKKYSWDDCAQKTLALYQS